MKRRQFLGLFGGVSGGLTGCLGQRAAPDQPTESPTSHTTTELAPGVTTSSAHAVTDVPDCRAYWVDVTPIDEVGPQPLHYAQLPPREQVIVKTAVGPQKWASCNDDEPAFFDFRDRVMERRRHIDGETVYLQYHGSPYCLTVWAEDLMISSCPPPE